MTDKKIIDLILKNNQTLYNSDSTFSSSIDLLYKKFKSNKTLIYAKNNACVLSKKYLLNNNSNFYTKYDFNKENENKQTFNQKYFTKYIMYDGSKAPHPSLDISFTKYLMYKNKYIKLKKINNINI